MDYIKLKPGKEKKIRNHYPWVFRDDIATFFKDRTDFQDGSVVQVLDHENHFVAIGSYNSKSHIPVRILSKQNVLINRDFFYQRIKKAVEFRKSLSINSNSMRFIHAEADRLPGLMVDQFDNFLVVQFRTMGMEIFRKEIIEILAEVLKPKGIYERSDMESRADEGLEAKAGTVFGESPDELIEISENNLKFLVDIANGHKTGFYLDQRENRLFVQSLIKPNQNVLDLYSYTGGFAMAMAKSGARVTAVDTEAKVIDVSKKNAELNGVSDRINWHVNDVFYFLEDQNALLKKSPDKAVKYDVIVIDPPAIAKRKEGLDKLKRTYFKLLSESLPLLKRGGHIVLSSCAYHLDVPIMLETARYASADMGITLRTSHITFQPPDHPWILQIPESLYLKTVYFQLPL